jgi:hypothetical protein
MSTCYEYDDNTPYPETPDKTKRKNDDKAKHNTLHRVRRRILINAILLCCFLIGTGYFALPRKLEQNYEQVAQTASAQMQFQVNELATYTANQLINQQSDQMALVNAASTTIANQMNANATTSANLRNGDTGVISVSSNCTFTWQYTQDTTTSLALQTALEQTDFIVQSVQVSTFGELQACRDAQGNATQSQSVIMERNPLITLVVTEATLNDRDQLGEEVGRLLTLLDAQAIDYLHTLEITFASDSTSTSISWKADFGDALRVWQSRVGGKTLLAFGMKW